jgi:phosphoribosylaminoimidazole carboxylase PurE protein
VTKEKIMKPKVLIVMGSDSDLSVMKKSAEMLDDFAVPYHMTVTSAHRTPERTRKIVKEAEKTGTEVIIAGAGMAAHLPGVVASYTVLPVIGVPIDSSSLNGIDALLSIVQMPPGIPVAAMSVGKAGAKNAALLAVQILSRKDKKLAGKLLEHRQRMSEEVEIKAKKLKKKQ